MLTHNHLACASRGCAAVITVHPQEEKRLRRTGESFYCPAGHSNFFPEGRGPTPEQKRIRQLEQMRDRMARRLSSANDRAEILTRGIRACPLGCGWEARRRLFVAGAATSYLERVGHDLAEHLVAEHGARPETVRLLEAGEEIVDGGVVE